MKHGKILLVAGLLLGLNISTSYASLTSGTANGQSLVYSSVSNVTWTADANLLKTFIDNQGYEAIINAIIAVSPTIQDTPNVWDNPQNTGYHTVRASDFSVLYSGQANWFGAQAFVTYLNSISYAGSANWSLPSAGSNPQSSFVTNSHLSDLGDLYYNELGNSAGSPILLGSSYFTNAQPTTYWLNNEYSTNPAYAWWFSFNGGGQSYVGYGKAFHLNVWAVSPGNLLTSTPVPLPSAAWLFSSAILGFVGLKRRSSLVA